MDTEVDIKSLSDADLKALHTKTIAAFKALAPEGDVTPTQENLDAMAVLADDVEALKAELNDRNARFSRARDLATQVLAAADTAEGVIEDEDDADEAEDDADEASDAEAVSADDLTASGKNQALDVLEAEKPATVALAAQGAAGYSVGQEMTIADMAKSINSRLGGFNASSYAAARQKGRRQSERFTIARLPRQFDEGAIVTTEDPKSAMAFAVDESRLPGNSLVASGGWCAPSETLYDLCKISEQANLISVPEIQINRGGIRFTQGPDFRTVFADTGFCYTEAEDIAGDYNGAGGGTKPCTDVPCPPFQEQRLGYCGVCIGAGLLQQRGYPEVIEDYIAKALDAHAHRVSASVTNSMVANSDPVVFPGPQAGAVAPLLSAIDLQATHYRAINRMSDTSSLEVVLPTWIKAVLRSDLARRQGVDLLDVTDARVAAWFAQRNVAAQYIVDWQDISATAASGFTAAPTGVQFLLYNAGTFVKGVSDSITLENIYDSVGLGTNDYTALFTEDPYLVAKRCHDSRVVTVPICPDGATHQGILIDCKGVAGS